MSRRGAEMQRLQLERSKEFQLVSFFGLNFVLCFMINYFPPEENRFDKTFYKYVIEHKDILRANLNLANGLMMYKPEIDDFMKEFYDKHKYLWAENRDEIIKEFVKTDPLTVDIRDKFIYYDNITEDLENMARNQIIGAIEIRMSEKRKLLKYF